MSARVVTVAGACTDCPFEHWSGQASDQPYCWAADDARDLPTSSDERRPPPEWCPLREGVTLVELRLSP